MQNRQATISAVLLEDIGVLRDRDLWLELRAREPENPVRGWVPAYRFAMRLDGVEHAVGRLGFRVGTTHAIEQYAGHLGYEVSPAFRGHRLAERSCRLILPLARRHGFQELWITCNPDNLASRRTCERLGAELIEIVDVPHDSEIFAPGSERKCRYLLPL
jgi:tagatose 1,6-diphosphate aldolase